MPLSDVELLRDYATNHAEPAFADLVRRHLNFVYAAAERQLGSSALAADVAQSVFLDLARNASNLQRGSSIIAWLHLVTRRTALDHIRSEARRRAREQVAVEITAMDTTAIAWDHVAPLLDEILIELNPADRTALLLRYFEDQPLREVGFALGVSEDAAQKRIARALDQLRQLLVSRGVPVTIAGLLVELPLHAIQTAPANLSPMITSLVSTHITAAVTLGTTIHAVTMTTTKKFFTAAAMAVLISTAVVEAVVLARKAAEAEAQRHRVERLEAELLVSREEQERTDAEVALTRDELSRERAKTQKFTAADPEIEEALDKWLQGVVRLKHILEKERWSQIPELAYLTPKDWLDATKENPLESDMDHRRALNQLRIVAKMRFVGKLYIALQRYSKQNNGQPPSDPIELMAYFDLPIDPAILKRYGIFSTNDQTNDNVRLGGQWEIREKQAVDPYYDQLFKASANGWGYGGPSQFDSEVTSAIHAYKIANNAALPKSPSQLLPYLKSSIDPAFVQMRLDEWNRQ